MANSTELLLTCLEGNGEPENAMLSLVAEAETAFEHTSETGWKMQLLTYTPLTDVSTLTRNSQVWTIVDRVPVGLATKRTLIYRKLLPFPSICSWMHILKIMYDDDCDNSNCDYLNV